MRVFRSGAFAIASALVLLASAARTASSFDVGSCVTPKASVDHTTKRLIQKFIDVFGEPHALARPIYIKVASPMPLRVVGRDGKYLQVVGGKDSPFNPDKPIGWVRASDVQVQELRNCN